MSSGYQLAFDYPYVEKYKEEALKMEKANPFWQPQHDKAYRTQYRAGQVRGLDGPVGTPHYGPSVGGPKHSESQDHRTYNNFYKTVGTGYKSSGNQGGRYMSSDELRKVDRQRLPYMNYDKNSYDNVVPDFEGKVEMFDSILDVVDDGDRDYGLLTSPESKPVPKPKVGRGARSGGKVSKPTKAQLKKLATAALVTGAAGAAASAIPALGKAAAEAMTDPAFVQQAFELASEGVAGGGRGARAPPKASKAKLKLSDIEKQIRPTPGKGIKRPVMSADDLMMSLIKKAVPKSRDLEGSGVDKKKLTQVLRRSVNAAAKAGKFAARPTIQFGLPAGAAALSTALGLSPVVGTVVGQIAASLLDKALFSQKGKGVASYSGGAASGGDLLTPQKRRGALIKKLMKEKGMSLPQASKYIKSEGMSY